MTNLYEFRKKNRLSLASAGKLLGRDRVTISNWERGLSKMPLAAASLVEMYTKHGIPKSHMAGIERSKRAHYQVNRQAQ